ncbi:uncharacterized protein LOC110455607 [Mizuhopecten yessoensis]|uniref:IgGFc-binding protein n=1 Tax=Mizuhopecten yessoensis TaxID=6573 RepID=A0A210QCU3_MIZYE|nr:uncharacterized protein LOC110455607 [Mizuhopecten yessoensis]OWF46532.1 IgGFc-binding protein [Mizuhopecten yessoensis]
MATKALIGAVFVGLVLQSSGLTCYECYSAREPQLCTYHRECGQNEKCGTHKTRDNYGATVYHLECLYDTICEGSESPPTFVGRRKRDSYQSEVTCCDTDLCNHGNNIAATTEIPIDSTTVLGCHDNSVCEVFKHLQVQTCDSDDIAIRLCPSMCNRCNDVTSDVPMSGSVTSGLEVMSPSVCRDTNTNCAYLDDTVRMCEHHEVAIHLGCQKTCNLCDAISSTGTYPPDVTNTSNKLTTETTEPDSTPQSTELIYATSERYTEYLTRPNSTENSTPYTFQPRSTENLSGETFPSRSTPHAPVTTTDLQEQYRTSASHLLPDTTYAVTTTLPPTTTPRLCDVTPPTGGQEYVFLYPTNKVPADSHLDLLLASNEAGSLTLRGLGGHVCLNYTYTNESKTIQVPQLLQIGKQRIENNGIQVITSNDVTLHAMYHDPSTTDGFLILPVRELSDTYVVPSYDKNGIFKTFIGVTAVEDGTTLEMKLHTNHDYFLNGRTYRDGDKLTIYLNALEAFELAHTGDVTGTLISSNHPIAVQTGSQCSSVPVGTGTCNHLQEMVPPVSGLGSVYIVPPLVSSQGYIVRIIAAYPTTIVDIKNGDHAELSGFILPEAGNFSNIEVTSSALTFINSSQPVLVTHYAEGAHRGEPAMTVIPPLYQYRTEYDISVSDRQGYENYLALIIPTNHINDVMINGVTLSSLADVYKHHGIHDSIVYSAVDVKVDPGRYHVTCEPPTTEFGLLVYGVSGENAYEYPGGL